jgi:hypothetical protein
MSDLSYCNSLKSFSLNLIAGEIGFLSIHPISEESTYQDFVSFFENIRKKVKDNDLSDEYCNFYHNNKSHDFDVDFQKYLQFVLEIIRRIDITNNMCGAVDSYAVRMNVNYIYEAIGKILNEEDDYFLVLQSLWNTMVDDKESYGETYEKTKEDKLNRLAHSFLLSKNRIDQLKTL